MSVDGARLDALAADLERIRGVVAAVKKRGAELAHSLRLSKTEVKVVWARTRERRA